MPFVNRTDAGRRLAGRLRWLAGWPTVVLGLPRGGVPVAYEVARALGAPLDVVLVRKLGAPAQPELAMGALGEGGIRVLNDEVLAAAHVTPEELARVEADEWAELERRGRRYRQGHPPIKVAGRATVVVDDGLATGSTACVACRVARQHGAKKVVLAVPVAPPGWTERLAGVADHFVCVWTPEPFYAIGQFYEDFSQTSDEDVVACLSTTAASPPPPSPLAELGGPGEPGGG